MYFISNRYLLCLGALIGGHLADMNTEICKLITYSCGPSPPVLPTSFVMKGVKRDLQDNGSFDWFEEYFDPENMRAKYVEITNGEENHYIFDYLNEQIISYVQLHPGAARDKSPITEISCFAQDMEDSPIAKVLGLKYGKRNSLTSRMYTSYETLRYGGQHSYAFNGSTMDVERGLDGMKFRGCAYDQNADSTFDITFEWTGENVSPAFGSMTVPLRIEERGGYYSTKPDKDPTWNPVQIVKNIAWFQLDPYMNPELFQPPARMSCINRKTLDPSERPKVSSYFSTRMETFLNVQDWQGKRVEIQRDTFQEVWYDYGQKLVRLDYVPNDLVEELILLETFDKVAMVTSVHDFNNGISFYTDKVQGLCVSMDIPVDRHSLFISKKSTSGNAIMATPQEALGIDETLKYKGKYVIRGMDCKGYTGQINSNVEEGKPIPQIKEVFFTTDGWHQDLDGEEDFAWPVRDVQVFSSMFKNKSSQISTETNYYKFKTTVPSLSVYDITGCAINMKKKFFQLTLTGPKPEIVKQWYDVILQELHKALVNTANVGSPLRVQDVKILFPVDGKLILSFTLLDIFAVNGSVSSPRKGSSLDAAKSNLESQMNDALFSVRVKTDPRSQDFFTFDAVAKSLKEMQRPEKQSAPLIDNSLQSLYSAVSHVAETMKSDTSPKEDNKDQKTKGHTKGALAGLGVGMLIVGLALGVSAMLFYFKKYQKRHSTTETADFALNASTHE